MEVIEHTIEFNMKEPTVVTIGKFDGFHKGHEKILNMLLKIQKEKKLKSVVFTFSAPPSLVFGDHKQKVLTTNDEKRLMFERMGVDYLVEFPFNERTAAISAENFIEDILLKKLQMKAIVVGTDCRFGHRGSGNVALLSEYAEEKQFECHVIKKERYNHKEISSSMIRSAIERGNLLFANELLVYPYTIYGEVVHGRKLGRTLGMPTVNQIPEEQKLLPPRGVYYSSVVCRGIRYDGITNIGCKPTVNGDIMNGVETYIYEFKNNIYGDYITISLLQFKRPEMKFPSVEALKIQMQTDIAEGFEWHAEFGRPVFEKKFL
ncbi:MAG: bifunctional riboflavin kinase/FAD synthetase [Clostridia bacterium]|nr:bifunctional riboflavin kinase/FAD synthetase [Clostridia bacterium]